MKTSRDVALIVMFAALSFVFQVSIGQLPGLITGNVGMGYIFTIVYSIIQSVAYLLYEGRRWRILAQALILNLLYLIFIPNWTPPVAMATITSMFIVDVIFNSFYGSWKKRNRLFRWILTLQLFSWTINTFLNLLFLPLYMQTEMVMELAVPFLLAMLPIIIIEATAGSYLGHKIYQTVQKIPD
jgi:hypothetical protein